jgi:DNA-binding ferritin-like protein
MENYILLCANLFLLYHYGKDIHHHVEGEAFNALHEAIDTYANNKYDTMDYFDYIDTIKEQIIAGSQIEPFMEREYIAAAMQKYPEYAPTNQENFIQYMQLINETLDVIEHVAQNTELADNSRLGDLAKYLKQYAGLIFLQVRTELQQQQLPAGQEQITNPVMEVQQPQAPQQANWVQRIMGGR